MIVFTIKRKTETDSIPYLPVMVRPSRIRRPPLHLFDNALGTPPGGASRSSERRVARRGEVAPEVLAAADSRRSASSRDLNCTPDTAPTETVLKTSDFEVTVTVERKVVTSMMCPCPSEECEEYVKVGKYGFYARGVSACVHCGVGAEKRGWNGIAELTTHVQSRQFTLAQGLAYNKKAPNEVLGRVLCHSIDAPENVLVSGEGVERFKCPKCSTETRYALRFSHAVSCLPKYD